MVDITKDIQSMTSFLNHSAEFMQHLKRTGRPIVLTVNGKAAAVVRDAEAYQRLLDVAADASVEEGIRQGLDDLADGRTRPAAEVFDEVRAAYGIPR
jgi:PHD/YefM family antitoxin component YafN of YafNO toxin-antitoxin module